ncbi:MAG: tetratricopeptide repeat protein [Thermodesulfobacteriota bacterium]|nr:tetratricopeptide repeat protein [Thermodesulfobacteriota bacterium]
MSHINDALKKAQEEKDSIYKKYGRIISAPSYGKTGRKRKWLTAFLCASIVFLFSLFLLARYVTVPSDDTGGRMASVEKVDKKERVLQRQEKTPSPRVSEKPFDAGVLYQKALGYQQKNDLDKAERLYGNILKRDPEFVYALNNLGVIYMGKKRDEDAVEMFEKAIEHSDGYVDPYYNLACIYSKRGYVSKSLNYLKMAVQLNNSVKNWVKNDKDLRNVSSLEEFKEIVE